MDVIFYVEGEPPFRQKHVTRLICTNLASGSPVEIEVDGRTGTCAARAIWPREENPAQPEEGWHLSDEPHSAGFPSDCHVCWKNHATSAAKPRCEGPIDEHIYHQKPAST